MRVDLRDLPGHLLTEALQQIEQGHARAPWSQSLAFVLPRVAAALANLDDVPSDGVVALLSAVLAERSRMPAATEIVWTGPEPRQALSRDTAAVVAGMVSVH